MFSDETWKIIGRYDTIISFAALAVPIFYSAYELWKQRKIRTKYRKEIISTPGNRPTALIVHVRKPDSTSIRNQVQNYLASAFEGEPFPDEAIFLAEFNGNRNMEHADMDAVMKKVRIQVGKCVDYGTNRIHLFMSCPLPVAASVGEYLSNFAGPVIFHHNQPRKGYENWGPIQR